VSSQQTGPSVSGRDENWPRLWSNEALFLRSPGAMPSVS